MSFKEYRKTQLALRGEVAPIRTTTKTTSWWDWLWGSSEEAIEIRSAFDLTADLFNQWVSNPTEATARKLVKVISMATDFSEGAADALISGSSVPKPTLVLNEKGAIVDLVEQRSYSGFAEAKAAIVEANLDTDVMIELLGVISDKEKAEAKAKAQAAITAGEVEKAELASEERVLKKAQSEDDRLDRLETLIEAMAAKMSINTKPAPSPKKGSSK